MSHLHHLEKLEYFLTIAESGSIREASRQLRVAQPALTRAIQILEDEFKAELFLRSRKGISCTEAGKRLVTFAKNLIIETENLKTKLSESEGKVKGRLKVGTFESLTVYLWPDIISHLNSQFPDLNIDLLTNNGKVLRQQLLDGAIDMTVDVEPDPQEEILTAPLYKDEYQFFCANKSRHMHKKSLSLSELAMTPIIYVPKGLTANRTNLKTQLALLGVNKSNRTYELDTFEAVKAMVCKDLGVGIIPYRVAENELKNKRLQRVEIAELSKMTSKHQICVSVRKHNSSLLKIKAAMEGIRRVCAERYIS